MLTGRSTPHRNMETPRPNATPMSIDKYHHHQQQHSERRRNSEGGTDRRSRGRSATALYAERSSSTSRARSISIQRRRLSGPKSHDVDILRRNSKQNRRRLSDGLRRRSKESRASIRRLSLDRASALPNPVIKVGGATTPRATPMARGFGWEGGSSDHGDKSTSVSCIPGGDSLMIVDEGAAPGQAPPSPVGAEGSSHWTPEMVMTSAKEIQGGDRASQLRYMSWGRGWVKEEGREG